MGLDNFWRKTENHEEGFDIMFDPPLQLCGGMFSGQGAGSFRGKVYYRFMRNVIGIDLYLDVNTQEKIKEVALKFTRTEYNEDWSHYYDLTEEDYHDLHRMFVAYAEAGAVLLAWY